MRILTEKITRNEILDGAEVAFDDEMVKGVVDIKRNLLAIDASLHADLEKMLLDDGSSQYDLWGINLYPEEEDLIEFDSMINLRPNQGNRTRGVENAATREKITEVVAAWVE